MVTPPHGDGDKGLVEGMWDEQKGVNNGVVAEKQGLNSTEEDKLCVKRVAKDINNGLGRALPVADGRQKTQQLQGPMIRWERFLPIGSPKVLLVENDDSTRHVVSALLQNCSYEVVAVADGVQAWNVLEDVNNHIDLVLAEVVMPSLSGIGLLGKIMSHKTFSNIPVIMMSSHDPMGLVFKCLSKGAVDFLVKPIRKNELKNLWQHVWRRCHSSCGSGSESGIQTKKYAKSKSYDVSENNTGSSDERDNGSIGLSIQDGSDEGSGTQSSWTKQVAEDVSPQATPWDQLVGAPDSTCVKVIHAKPETLSNRWAHVTGTKKSQEQEVQLEDNTVMGKDLEIGVSRNPDLRFEHQLEKFPTNPTSKRQNKLTDLDRKRFDGQVGDNCENLRDQAAKKVITIVNGTDSHVKSKCLEPPNALSDMSFIKDRSSCGSRELPSLELSLKRFREVENAGTNALGDHNVLRHSDLSAFSKYNTSSPSQAPMGNGNVGSCSPLDNRTATMKTETVHGYPSNSNGTPLNQQSNESTNNDDMASTTKYVIPKPEALNKQPESMSAFNCFHSSTFQSAKNNISISPPLQVTTRKADDVIVSTVHTQSSGSHQKVQVQHHHHHYHHYHHHYDVQEHQPHPDQDDVSLNTMAAAAPQCGSTNVLGAPREVTAENYSGNGSASGSNHGSNGQNGSSIAVNTGVANIEGDNVIAGSSGKSNRIGGDGAEDRFAQREAALTKFRQKRKERCFEKKVRYQSRKKLAEQRPRSRGQFVRQTMCEAEKDTVS